MEANQESIERDLLGRGAQAVVFEGCRDEENLRNDIRQWIARIGLDFSLRAHMIKRTKKLEEIGRIFAHLGTKRKMAVFGAWDDGRR